MTQLTLHILQQHLPILVLARHGRTLRLDGAAVRHRSDKARVQHAPGILEELPLQAGDPRLHLLELGQLPGHIIVRGSLVGDRLLRLLKSFLWCLDPGFCSGLLSGVGRN